MPVLGVVFAAFMIVSKVVCKNFREKDALEVLLERKQREKDKTQKKAKKGKAAEVEMN